MKKKVKKYYVKWIETHTVEVTAEDEKTAFETALKKPPIVTRESTDHPIVIAA